MTEKQPTHLPLTTFYKAVEEDGLLVALASQKQVEKSKNPSKHKAPAIKWDKAPHKYTGFNDEVYGTGIRCDWIPSLNRQLVVIDIDNPKKPGDIPVEVIKKICREIIENTYTVETPSGGVHIYLLSKMKPLQSQPKINIDYQTNTGTGMGKYVVANYRWSEDGTHKEHYKKLEESPEKIMLVGNADYTLNFIMEGLKEAGLVTTPKEDYKEDMVSLLKKYYEPGSRDNYSCAIAGYLRKKGYKADAIKNIIKEVFQGDEQLSERIAKVDKTFRLPLNEVIGYNFLKTHMSKVDLEKLRALTEPSDDSDVGIHILNYLSKNKEPSAKLIADYVNKHLNLYKNLDTNHYYQKIDGNGFVEIDERNIIRYLNDEFGHNNISTKRCQQVLSFITQPVEKNYDIIEFNNGLYNTKTGEFNLDKNLYDEIPKLCLNIDFNPVAEPGTIGRIIDEIFDNPRYPRDKEKWLRAVGHAFMGYNRIGKMVVVQGQPGSGKSTLTTLLKRVFNYSSLPTNVINENQRFTLYPMVDKDVNIDDDINNGLLKSIGKLNTIVTGDGIEVEIKGENRSITAENPQIPRLFANGNTLPPILGEGFERRLLLIHADNKIKYDHRDEMLQQDILLGEYDQDGLEWFVYTTIDMYRSKIDEPLTTEEEEARMKEEYDFKSYPLKKATEILFRDNYGGNYNIPVSDVNDQVKKWCRWAYRHGKISKEHRNPSIRQIKRAMDNAGYEQVLRRDGEETYRCYIDIELNPDMEFLIREDEPQKTIDEVQQC